MVCYLAHGSRFRPANLFRGLAINA